MSNREQPSLVGFLAELRSRDVTIKRELADAGAGVRVMTVHGAKGLEAPIVILADAASTEEGRDRRSIFMRRRAAALHPRLEQGDARRRDDGASAGRPKRRRRPSIGASSTLR